MGEERGGERGELTLFHGFCVVVGEWEGGFMGGEKEEERRWGGGERARVVSGEVSW